ncbi:Proto-oncogene Mas, partial [Ophiophagus hannah]
MRMDDDSCFKSGGPQDDKTIQLVCYGINFLSPESINAVGVICVSGLMGNGRTIYILTNSIKRIYFTIFILNLSITDFVSSNFIIFVVVSLLDHGTDLVHTIQFLFFELFFTASQFLLMAISLDRCVAVHFPLWHCCHCPPYFSKLVCGLIWILSFLLSAVDVILSQISSSPLLFQLIVNGLLCTPVMIVSTATILIHMRSKLQHNQRKLLTTTLLAVLCFLLLSLPINAFYVIAYLDPPRNILMTIGFGCASLNSSTNPLLYFSVGRKKRGREQPRTSFKVALQRHNDTDAIHSKSKMYHPGFLGTVIYYSIILICIPGIIGNGAVIHVLRYRMKRNPFTVYILNLAMADSGTLIFLFISVILYITIEDSLIEIIEVLVFTYCTGQLLLTIISIDRCLALFFPIWYRCHQPPYLSTIICIITWIVSILFCGIHYTLILVQRRRSFSLFYHVFIYIAVCIPLMMVSTLALLIKGYVKSQMQRRRKLLIAILLSLFFFLVFSFPPIAIYAINVIYSNKYFNLITLDYLCACLNSSRGEKLILTLFALLFFLIFSIPLSAVYSFDVLFIWNHFHLIAYTYLFDFLIVIVEGLVWIYCIGQLFLTIISIDRCLALFFPVWYQYHQSICLSTMICSATWIISLFIYALNYSLVGAVWVKEFPPFYHILICTSVCVPIIVVSSLTLFIKSYLKSRMKKQGKLPKAILLALLFFLIFSFPLIGICLINVIYNEKCLKFIMYGYLCACLNSSVNPLIYFLVGRKKGHKTTCHLKINLQRVFEEEENEKQPKVQSDIPSCCTDRSEKNPYFYISLPGSEK